ncbi:uncharacterized protein LOC119261009 [Talpa occidentalis]|uniref:uncharacterized protein LOC119261009 n=1 Tax=Talpa occidentalis TaxID=50954 RepID=UPI001890408A|nr:uncharacterized protein LOC119261009 [Talpa occidentalis]
MFSCMPRSPDKSKRRRNLFQTLVQGIRRLLRFGRPGASVAPAVPSNLEDEESEEEDFPYSPPSPLSTIRCRPKTCANTRRKFQFMELVHKCRAKDLKPMEEFPEAPSPPLNLEDEESEEEDFPYSPPSPLSAIRCRPKTCANTRRKFQCMELVHKCRAKDLKPMAEFPEAPSPPLKLGTTASHWTGPESCHVCKSSQADFTCREETPGSSLSYDHPQNTQHSAGGQGDSEISVSLHGEIATSQHPARCPLAIALLPPLLGESGPLPNLPGQVDSVELSPHLKGEPSSSPTPTGDDGGDGMLTVAPLWEKVQGRDVPRVRQCWVDTASELEEEIPEEDLAEFSDDSDL